MTFKKTLYLFFLFNLPLFWINSLLAEKNPDIIYQSSDSLILQFDFDKPGIQTFIPFSPRKILLSAYSKNVTIKKLNEEKHVEMVEKGTSLVADIAIGGEDAIQPALNMNLFPANGYEVKEIGTPDKRSVFVFTLYPYKLNSAGTELEWMESIRLLFRGESVTLLENDSARTLALSKLIREKSAEHLISEKYSKNTYKTLSEENNQSKLKIWVQKEGIYRIPQPMVVKAGWDISRMDPRYFRLVGSSGECPVRIVGEEDGSFDFYDYIEFYGEPLWDTQNSDGKRLDVFGGSNIYWLEYGNKYGLRMARETDWPFDEQSFPNSYLYTQHEERDAHFNRLPYATDVNDGDYWFYSGPIVGGEKRSFTFDIHSPDGYSSQLVEVKLKLRGQSQSAAVNPIEIYLNDRSVARSQWTGNSPILIKSSEFSPFYLTDGKNTLTVANQSAEKELSQLLIDWFEITYPREYWAEEDYIRFCAPKYSVGEEIQFKIEGFSNAPILLYKKGVSYVLGGEVSAVSDSITGKTYQLIFKDKIISDKTEYIALTPQRIMAPDSVALIEPSDLCSQSRGADYIMITPSDSLGEDILNDLIQLRQSQGLIVNVVNLDEIYNVFNSGIPNPEAIRLFLKYAYLNWSPKPRFVLLVGDGYYNNRAAPKSGNVFPVPMYQTWKYGGSATDYKYALLIGDDNYPDIAIGRLPIRTRLELAEVIDKIIGYEKSPPDLWKNQFLCIASGGYDNVFMTQTKNLIENVLPPQLHSNRLYLSGSLSDPYVGGTEDLLRYFQEGLAFVNFRGHGGGAIWSDVGLLDLDDIELMENKGKLPVVTSMTCFTGDFSGGLISLGEALFCHENIGSIAFWGATGVGWVDNDYYLLTELYRIINASPDLTLGEMIQQAKTNFLLTNWGSIPTSEVFQFNLIGDPAIRLSIPNEKTEVILEAQSVHNSDTLHVQGAGITGNYNVVLEITDHNLDVVSSHLSGHEEPQWNVSLPLSQNFRGDEGGIRAYLWEPERTVQENGYVPFTIGKTYFDSLTTIPSVPTNNDTIFFSVRAENSDSIHQITCYVYSPFSEAFSMKKNENNHKYFSINGIGPLEAGQTLRYFYIAENSDETMTVSDTITIRIPTLPDVFIQSIEIGGTEQVELNTIIQNAGETDILDVSVKLTCPEVDYSYQDAISVEALSQTTWHAPFFSTKGTKMFYASVNPDSTSIESRYDNNTQGKEIDVRYFNVTPESGTTFGENSADTVGISGKCLCVIPPGAVAKKTALFIDVNKTAGNSQEDSSFVSSEIYTFSFQALPDKTVLNSEATLIFETINNDSSSANKLYRFNTCTGQWILVPSLISDSQIIVKSNRLGKFCFISSDDINPPMIEMLVENQPFSDDSYVPRRGIFSIIIQDESGVDINPDKIQVSLDHILQEQPILTVPDSTEDPRNLVLTLRPELEPGEHSIAIQASDIHGNVAQTGEMRFQVSSRFDIQYLGNHPNPFKYETVFCYILTDAAREVSLKIYTVSGKLIRTFANSELISADYHEIEWDGKDEWGSNVANGVYFFRLKAEGIEKSREIKGKIAKIH